MQYPYMQGSACGEFAGGAIGFQVFL